MNYAALHYDARNNESLLTYFRDNIHEDIEKLLKVKYMSMKSQLWRNQINKCAGHQVPLKLRGDSFIAPFNCTRQFEKALKLSRNIRMNITDIVSIQSTLDKIIALHGRLLYKLRQLIGLSNSQAKILKCVQEEMESVKKINRELSFEGINIDTLLPLRVPEVGSEMNDKKIQKSSDDNMMIGNYHKDAFKKSKIINLSVEMQNKNHQHLHIAHNILADELKKSEYILARVSVLKNLQKQYLDWISSTSVLSHGNKQWVDENNAIGVVTANKEVHRCVGILAELEEAIDHIAQKKLLRSKHLKLVAPQVELNMYQMSSLSMFLDSSSYKSDSQVVGYGCGGDLDSKAMNFIRESLGSIRLKNRRMLYKMIELIVPFSPYDSNLCKNS